MRPRTAAALRDNAELLRAFLQIARLVEVAVKPPPDRATDFAGAAAAARDHGMERLATRLERAAGATA
jgi:hypothetical protein